LSQNAVWCSVMGSPKSRAHINTQKAAPAGKGVVMHHYEPFSPCSEQGRIVLPLSLETSHLKPHKLACSEQGSNVLPLSLETRHFKPHKLACSEQGSIVPRLSLESRHLKPHKLACMSSTVVSLHTYKVRCQHHRASKERRSSKK
jgi:hypothetical protein